MDSVISDLNVTITYSGNLRVDDDPPNQDRSKLVIDKSLFDLSGTTFPDDEDEDLFPPNASDETNTPGTNLGTAKENSGEFELFSPDNKSKNDANGKTSDESQNSNDKKETSTTSTQDNEQKDSLNSDGHLDEPSNNESPLDEGYYNVIDVTNNSPEPIIHDNIEEQKDEELEYDYEAIREEHEPFENMFLVHNEEHIKAYLEYLLNLFHINENNLLISVNLYAKLIYGVMKIRKDKKFLVRLVKAFLNNNVLEVFRLVDLQSVWGSIPDPDDASDVDQRRPAHNNVSNESSDPDELD